ncbi:MAG: DUF4254 domain-containing protein, partial [Chitinophagaceae bacterium]
MNNTQYFYSIFSQCISDYNQIHDIHKRIEHPLNNPHDSNSLEHLLFRKNHIDNMQWDMEDMLRDPEILPHKALQLKRRIYKSNQDRTD